MGPKKLSKRERKKLLNEKAQKAAKITGVGVEIDKSLLWQLTGGKSHTRAVIVSEVFAKE